MSHRNILSITAASLALAFSMGVNAQALYVTPEGNIGIGTDSPLNAVMEVYGTEGKAKIKVTEEGPEKQRDLFHIINNGITHFKIENTVADTQWVFTNAGAWFNISLQGTGGAEFKLYDNGDAVLRGILVENSDVNSKQNFETVDGNNILEKLKKLEISKWSYKDAPTDRHVGPMAQDFYAAFGLGNTDKGIATLDTSGIALAAIKALIEENTSLKERLGALESQQAEMQAVMMKVLENQQAERVLTSTLMN